MSNAVNPYAPPSASCSAELRDRDDYFVPAGRGARLINYIVDFIARIILTIVGIALVIFVWGDAGSQFLGGRSLFFFDLVVFMPYYIVLEAATGRTLGKLLTGTKVVDDAGEAPSFGQILGRTFSRLIPFEPLSFFGVTVRGWHDRLSATHVVSVHDPRRGAPFTVE